MKIAISNFNDNCKNKARALKAYNYKRKKQIWITKH